MTKYLVGRAPGTSGKDVAAQLWAGPPCWATRPLDMVGQRGLTPLIALQGHNPPSRPLPGKLEGAGDGQHGVAARRGGDRLLSPAAPRCGRLAAATLQVPLQDQHHLPVLLQAHGVGLHILGTKTSRQPKPPGRQEERRPPPQPPRTRHPTSLLPTLRMRLKSCLSTRRKWQLSSRRMMVAARGASFTSASCPKSSPSCRVATRPWVRGTEGEGGGGSLCSCWRTVTWGVRRAPLCRDAPTLPWVTTFTEPFQMMYHDVPLSPWLNTAGQRRHPAGDRGSPQPSPSGHPVPSPQPRRKQRVLHPLHPGSPKRPQEHPR